ncbi:MAG: cyclic nucleotide-binding domain-containing protein [Nocardioides sp.]
MSTSPADALSNVDLFRKLSGRQLKKLAAAGRQVVSPSGKRIAGEGDSALAFHVILSGEAEVTRGGQTLRVLGPGDYFGEISMIDGKPRSASVTTVGEVTAFAIPHASFAALVEADAEISHALLLALCARLRDAESRT